MGFKGALEAKLTIRPVSGGRRIALAGLTLFLAAGFLHTAAASVRTWSIRNSDRFVEGEMIGFDFGSREVIVRDSEQSETRVPASQLTLDGRFQALLSPAFVRSYPEEEFTPQQGYFILIAIAAPALFLLLSFYFCAMILLKKFNPLRAIVGWIGSVLLGGFLVAFYVVLSARSAGAATGIAIFGALVVAGLLSLFVSIIYGCTVTKGFKLLALHLFGAAALILATVVLVRIAFDPTALEPLFDRVLFHPIGMI